MEARGEPAVDMALVVELAVAFGISAQAATIRLDTARYLRANKQREDLAKAIRDGEHRALLYRLGLRELNDTIAAAKDDLPRLPARLRVNALTGYEAGVLDVDRLAALLRRDAGHTKRDLAEHGIQQRR